ncbi:MAG: hypothetical protein KME11_05340 [Timaviella obliquedivisa GSE-PSE-MK23-08B]|jgi:hypothetical protein|nr:hypothetical protein [Timaviella obliquedivisa GSE-PSE-MK23-08B]
MTSQLDRIERLLLETKLGFSSGSQRVPVYCNRSKGGLWYTLDKVGDDLVPRTIEGDRLTCYLEGLLIKSVTRKKKGECDKFRLYVQGDRPYVLESGWSTLPKEQSFAKSLVWTIAHMTQQQLQQPIILNPHPGEEDGVMFCRMIQEGKSIYVERQGEPNWDDVLERAIANLEHATGRSFREKPEEALLEETPPDPLAQVPPSEMPLMDRVNHLLKRLDDIEKCRQFYHWITDRAVWKQVNEVPATASSVKQELAKAIANLAPDDLSPVRALTDVQLNRLGWEAEKTQNTLLQRYGKRSRSALGVSELYLFLWYLEGQQQASLQRVG